MSYTPKMLLQQCPELTTLPEIYHKLNEAISSPSCTTGIISRIISQDAILTAKVLKVVNSAVYGYPHKIDDIPKAVLIIGLQQLNDLVLANTAISLCDHFKPQLFTIKEFWQFSIASALGCRFIGNMTKEKFSERLFVSGLLHNIGKLVMAITQPKLTLAARHKSITDEISISEAEKLIFGFDHTEMNHFVLTEWNIPEAITDISSHYLNPENSLNYAKEALVVRISHAVTQSLQFGTVGEHFIIPIKDGDLERIKLTANDIETIMVKIEREFRAVSQSLLH